jgi:hypothetical protein
MMLKNILVFLDEDEARRGEKRMGGRGVRRVQLLHGVDIEKRLRTSFKLKSGPNVQKRGILVPLTVFYLIYLLKKSVI